MKRCIECGNTLPDFARFCDRCAAPALQAPQIEPEEPAVEAVPAGWGAQAATVPTGPPPPRPGWAVEQRDANATYAYVRIQQTSGMAVVALVLGILTWFMTITFIGIPFAFVAAPVAAGLGLAARRQISAEPELYRGSGMALAGITLGLSWLVLATIVVSLIVWGSAGWL